MAKKLIIILQVLLIEMGWVMVGRIGLGRIVVGKLEIGMENFFSKSVVLRIVSLGVEGVILVILAMLDMMSLTAGIGFMMTDKVSLATSKMQMCSEDNHCANIIDLQGLLPGINPIHLSYYS